jgi:DNA-binding SARP family transcriptional activator/TolB-like protein
VVAGVESGLRVQLLGTLTLRRAGANLPLPSSRKVRALIAYLALASRPLTRTHLCELLGDIADDPKGELRWCLSKIRGLFDTADRPRVQASGESISLDTSDCFVDALEVAAAAQQGFERLTPQRLRELAALFGGEFLGALELERSPQLNAWITAQRRRFAGCHAAILEQLVKVLPVDSADVFGVLEKWLELAPLDRRAHELLLDSLARHGRTREGTEHLEATTRLFEAEGLDARPLRIAWQAAVKRNTAAAASLPAVSIQALTPPAPLSENPPTLTPRRASIAVMPLVDLTRADGASSGRSLAGALVHDVITRLAKLRSVAVIAQGTVFALAERGLGAETAGRALNVDYVASGSVRRDAERTVVMMELVETRRARIIWAEDFQCSTAGTFQVLDEIGNRIVAGIAGEIEMAERNRALLKPPSSLDAWEAHHRGLWHMYRFNADDNDQAQHFFQMAARLDPTFSRAHAGLSFTHFQNAFLLRIPDREREIEHAIAAASQALIADDRDPTAHWAMGRALWLRGEQDEALSELSRAVALSPNFALGHYALAFVQSQSGDARAAIAAVDQSRELSPFDPLLFAMLATRAIAHFRLGQYEDAAAWSMKAVSRPNAHVHIKAIAAQCLAAAERLEEGQALVKSIRKTHPRYGIDDYLKVFRFSDDAEALLRRNARLIGIG